MLARILMILVLGGVCGCNREQPTPTAAESRQLDDAANLLNEAPANLEGIDDSALAPVNTPVPAEPR